MGWVARIRAYGYAAVPAAVALLLGLRGLNSVGLWIDEFYTVKSATSGLGGSLSEAPELPYYAFMQVWTAGGRWISEDWLRLPSVIAVVLATVLVSVTARRLATPRAGLMAGLILAIAPGTQRYAQEARVYALGLMCASLATFALVTAARSERKRWWVLYSAAIATGALLLPITLAMLPGHAIVLARRPFWDTTTKRWVISCLACVPLMVLEVIALIRFSSMHVSDSYTPNVNNLWQAATWLTSAGTIDTASAAAFALAVLVLGLLTPASTRWVLAAVASSLSILLLSLGPMSWWLGRSFLPLTGLLAIAAGLSLGTLSVRRCAAVFAVMAVFVAPAYTEIRLPWSRGFDFRQASGIIDARWQSGDAIASKSVYDVSLVQTALQYYTGDSSRFLDPPASGGRVWVIDQSQACTPLQSWDLGAGHTLELCD